MKNRIELRKTIGFVHILYTNLRYMNELPLRWANYSQKTNKKERGKSIFSPLYYIELTTYFAEYCLKIV